MADKINIYIDAKVMFQMFEYAAYARHIYKTEIAGWGHYNKDNGIYKLSPLPKQIVRGAEVDAFPDAIYRDNSYDISDMVVQWHSHVDFACNPSPTDREQIKETMGLFPYLITIIVNCKHEYSAELHIKRSNGLELEEHITHEVNLVRYYNNPLIKKEVKKQCRLPKEKVVKEEKKSSIVVKETKLWAWHPDHGMGMFVNDDFYPDSGRTYIKNVRYNPLKKQYFRDHEGEEVVSFVSSGNRYSEDFSGEDYTPYGEVVTAELSDFDVEQIKDRMVMLENAREKDFQIIVANEVMWIQHIKSQTYFEIDGLKRETCVQGHEGDWNDFLKQVGALEDPYWYSPGDCIACNASGKSSKGEKCTACSGTGKKNIN